MNQKKTKKANGLIPIAEKNTFCTENEEELKEMGIEDGDTVRIYEIEFEFYN